MLKSGEAIASFFPATAMPDSFWWQALWPQPERVLPDLGIEPGMEVVDLCCGDGLFTPPLARLVRHVVAVDLDPEMLDAARAKVAAAGAAKKICSGRSNLGEKGEGGARVSGPLWVISGH